MAEVVWEDGSRRDLALEVVADLGEGKAGAVRLVRDTETGAQYAEKVFDTKRSLSQLLRDSSYALSFQAPFPYGANSSAKQKHIKSQVR